MKGSNSYGVGDQGMIVGTKVQNIKTGEYGHIIQDTFQCCTGNEDLVVYDGTDFGSGTDRSLLVEVSEKKPIPDPIKCGAGRGSDCCIFLSFGSNGFECERFSSLRDNLIFKTMVAKRHPKEPYPVCMIFN
jgi:hypothetical protein